MLTTTAIRREGTASAVIDTALGAMIARLERRTGLPFDAVDGTDGTYLANGTGTHVRTLPPGILEQLPMIGDYGVLPGTDELIHYAVRLGASDGFPCFGVGYVFRRPGLRPEELIARAQDDGWLPERIDAWVADHPVASPRILDQLIRNAFAEGSLEGQCEGLREELNSLGVQMQHTFEEISLLHMLTRNLKISRSPADLAEMCLDRVHVLVDAEGSAVWVDEGNGDHRFLVKGEVPFDEIGLAHLVARFDDHDWTAPLVRNNIDPRDMSFTTNRIRNVVVVPIAEAENRSGWIVACNANDGREFGTEEASLLGSIGTILGTHTRNIDLYRELEALLVSFVESLVQTLDAKDPYTRGHSDRVALIAERLGRELGLSDRQLEDLHLAGVLHDIGKIGVDDRILQKPGRLSDDEFEQIKQHPTIGYNILLGLKNLRRILPGVRNHHESWDGSGYPDGLAGEEIPLMARILAVADAYDAMGSDRPYRDGMRLEKLESIFREGSGVQWDARVIDAYFAVRDDVKTICERYTARRLREARKSQRDEDRS